jgi:hypothetical protein
MQFLENLELGRVKLEFKEDFGRGDSIEVRVMKKNLRRENLKEVFRFETKGRKQVLRGENWILKRERKKRYTLFFSDKEPSDVAIENTLRFVLSQEYPENGGVLVHSSSACLGKCGVCFIGKSGSGKTTILKLFKKFKPLNDDLNLLFLSDEKPWIFPLPILSRNTFYPLIKADALFILNKSEKDEIKKIKKEDGLTEIVSCLPFLHFSPSNFKKGLKVLEKILDYAPVYRLYFSLNGKVEEKIFELIRV